MGSSVSSRPPSRVSRVSVSGAPSSATVDDPTSSPRSPAASPKKSSVATNETTKYASSKGPTSPKKSPTKLKKVDQDRINQELKGKEEEDGSKAVTETKDVMISYSHAEMDQMKRIKEFLESHGLTVWVDISGLTAGVNFLTKIGQAIIDCKAFISLLSEKYTKSRCCRDELALAYVSQKPIYPIGLQTPQELLPLMDTGMRLQLARYDWFVVTNPDVFDQNMDDFSKKLRLDLYGDYVLGSTEDGDAQENTSPDVKLERPKLKRGKSLSNLKPAKENDPLASPFWLKHFKKNSQCTWDEFQKGFNGDYSQALNDGFGISDTTWLLAMLRRELEVEEDDIVHAAMFDAFCTIDEEIQPFWVRLQDQAIESYCMREVFNMESTVRVEAIENLGRLRSKSVIEALLDLLEDPDNNVRTVAALSLAKTGEASRRVIRKLMQSLDSNDRLVRESGCLALGHLQVKEAVPKLVDLWRNDYISSVRDASQVALKQIGGEEANKAIHITNLLAKEIRSLTDA